MAPAGVDPREQPMVDLSAENPNKYGVWDNSPPQPFDEAAYERLVDPHGLGIERI